MITRVLAIGVATLLAITPAALTAKEVEKAETSGPTSLSEFQPTPGLSAETVTDAQIDSFVEALAMINRVGARYTPQIDAETDGQKRKQLIQAANREIVAAVNLTADISPADFVAIDQASQNDAALNEKILGRIKTLNATGDGKIKQRAPAE